MLEDTARLAANMVERDLENSGQVGHTEKNVFTFDGNTEGRLQFPFYPLYKISSKVPDISTLVKLTANMGGVEYELAAENCTIEVGELGAIIQAEISGTLVDVARIMNTAADDSEEYIGLYAISTEQGYLASIEFAETIYPTNPKYLPGVCLPVVELSGVINADTTLTDKESALLVTVFESGTPVVIRCTFQFGADAQTAGQFVFNNQLMALAGQHFRAFGGMVYGLQVIFVEQSTGQNWNCSIEGSA